MPFRFRAKYIFLTYPRSDFSFDELYDFIGTIGKLSRAIVSRECHSDGGTHIHFAGGFQDPIETRNEKKFDFQDRHPNIQKARSWPAVVTYIKKDGDYKTYGFEDDPDGTDWSFGDFTEDPYTVAERCKTRRDWITWCIQNKIPPAYAFAIWSDFRSVTTPVLHEGDEGTGTIVDPLLGLFAYPGSSLRSLCLVGHPGIGKSTWAKKNVPKPALWVRHLDDLKDLDSTCKSIIFDDMDFRHLPRTTQIQLVDRENPCSIHCRHRVARIPAGVHRVFTGNSLMFIDDTAIKRRCIHWNDGTLDLEPEKTVLEVIDTNASLGYFTYFNNQIPV